MEKCFTIVAPLIFLGDHELNKLDSALTISGSIYVNLSFYGIVLHEKKNI
jgi:hypothetical protein